MIPAGRDCTGCKQWKPLSEFGKNSKGKWGVNQKCKECMRAWGVAYNLKANFNLTQKEYDRLLDAQDGKCAYCGLECRTGRKLAVDHCHQTGVIRGLLCMRCNKYKIGNLTIEETRHILEYLENPPAYRVLGIKMVPEDKIKGRRKRRVRRAKRKRS